MVILELSDDTFARVAEERGLARFTDAKGALELLTRIQAEMVNRAQIKKDCLARKCTEQELFTEALANRRIDIFIGNMTALVGQLHDAESPLVDAQSLFEALCERGRGYNIFLYGEVSDKDEAELMGYTCFDSMRGYRSGIRFGGRFGDQKLFLFENIGYQEQDRSMKSGIGVLPSENREDRVVKVVVPMN